MPLLDRAAQFSPFAALTGHHEAIKETARLTEEWIELDESRKEMPDEKKNGGAYLTVKGIVKKSMNMNIGFYWKTEQFWWLRIFFP